MYQCELNSSCVMAGLRFRSAWKSAIFAVQRFARWKKLVICIFPQLETLGGGLLVCIWTANERVLNEVEFVKLDSCSRLQVLGL